jgi:hypothetical protein
MTWYRIKYHKFWHKHTAQRMWLWWPFWCNIDGVFSYHDMEDCLAKFNRWLDRRRESKALAQANKPLYLGRLK